MCALKKIGGLNLAKCYQFTKFAKVWPLQNLGLYGNNETNDEMVLSAVDQVLNDFNVNSPVATAAQQIASTLIEWSKKTENKPTLKRFSDELIRNLETVLIDTISSTATQVSLINRDKLWRNF